MSTHALSADSGHLPAGTAMDSFRILRFLGAGGMGEVYLARDTVLGRRVALKVIRAARVRTEAARQRVLEEARATARFNHPHIVTIHAVGEAAGRPYVALEYLEGQTLAQRLAEQRPAQAEAIRIGRAVASAMTEAHAQGVQHRDLKPGNVFLTRDGRIRVLDFGLARPDLAADSGDPDGTGRDPLASHPSSPSGTPAYMSPEQWGGDPVTTAADVWALGVMLFELVAGRRPYDDPDPVTIGEQVLAPDPPPPVDAFEPCPADLAQLVADCLRKQPQARPRATDVLARLDRLLARGRDAAEVTDGPFRGLFPFDEDHSALFFGRDVEVAALSEGLRFEPVQVVVGASGAGKSSFVQAGVVPRLRERGPLVVLRLRPGADPFLSLAAEIAREETGTAGEDARELAATLREAPQQLNLTLQRLAEQRGSAVLLVVDQLEELYTLGHDPGVRRAFMSAVCNAADVPELPVRVVLVLREEFLSAVADGAGVSDCLGAITVLRSPGREGLEETLIRPVAAAGLRFEDEALVRQMVDEVEGEPACLPLLQFTGQMLWERRDREGGLLTHEAYRAIGGVAGALAQHADGVLEGMTPVEIGQARALMLRLVTAEGTRRTVAREALLDGLEPAAHGVLRRLIAARLVTGRNSPDSGEELREIVHESLVRAWGRLARWIDEGRDRRAMVGELEQAAALWHRRGCPADEVWQGDALRDAERLVALDEVELTGTARRFVLAGLVRQGRHQRRRRILTGVLVGQLVLVAVLLGLSALNAQRQRRDAEAARDQARVAEHDARTSLAWSLAERAAATPGMHEATLYAAASLREQENPAARGLLAGLVNRPRPSLVWQSSPGMRCDDLALTPDGGRLLCLRQRAGLRVMDLGTGIEAEPVAPRDAGVTAMALAPSGDRLAVGHDDGATRLYDPATGELVGSLPGQRMAVTAVAWSADGSRLATMSADRSVLVRSGPDLAAEQRIGPACAGARGVALAGDRTAVGCESGALEVWSPGEALAVILEGEHEAAVAGLAVVGATLVSVDVEGRSVAWDLARGAASQVQQVCDAVSGTPLPLPDGRSLVQPCSDGSVRIVDLSADENHPLGGHEVGVTAVAATTDGGLLVTAASDGSLAVWRDRVQVGRVQGPDSHPIAACITSDGGRLAVGDPEGVFRVVAMADGAQQHVWQGEPGQRVALSDDGRLMAVGAHSGDFYLVDLERGEEIHRRPADEGVWGPMRFCTDGDLLLETAEHAVARWRPGDERPRPLTRGAEGTDYWIVATADCSRAVSVDRGGPTTVWDLEADRPLFHTEESSPYFRLAEFSRDRRWLVTGDSEGVIAVWDVQRGEQLHRFVGHHGVVYTLDFSPDGSLLATGGADKAVHLWDVASGEPLGQLPHDRIVAGLGFPGDGQWLLTLDDHTVMRLWDLDTATPEPVLRGHRDLVSALTFDRSGRALLSVDHAGQGLRWDLDQGTAEPFGTELQGMAYVRFFGDSALATVSASEALQIWALDPPRRTGELALPTRKLLSTLLLDGGRQALGPGEEGGLQRWDLADGSVQPVEVDPDLAEPLWPVLVTATPDEQLAAVADARGLLYLVDLTTGRAVAQTQGPRLLALAIAPDGSRVAGATRDGVVRVWEPVESGEGLRALELRTRLEGHENLVAHLCFSPDGRWLASAGWDKTVRVWDAAAWHEAATLTGYGRSTLGMAFSPDSSLLATAQDDHGIRLWELAALDQPVDQLLLRVASESGLAWDGRQAVEDPELLRSRVVWAE